MMKFVYMCTRLLSIYQGIVVKGGLETCGITNACRTHFCLSPSVYIEKAMYMRVLQYILPHLSQLVPTQLREGNISVGTGWKTHFTWTVIAFFYYYFNRIFKTGLFFFPSGVIKNMTQTKKKEFKVLWRSYTWFFYLLRRQA